jgi:hypothetical protein
MTKALLGVFSLCMAMVFGVFIHYLYISAKDTTQSQLCDVVALSGANRVSFQKAFYQTNQNVAYPEMVGIKKMDFVYEK